MELRHLRHFIAVAEELHFARAAARLHIEQSPLSRSIKELEYRLGAQLFERTTRSTRLTWAGKVLLEEARRILYLVDQAKDNVRSAKHGFRGRLRIALSSSIPHRRLATLLASCREEEPEVELSLSQVGLSQQLNGLRDDLFDVGFALSASVGEGLSSRAIWGDPLVVVMPARHPLLSSRRPQLEEVLSYPIVMCDPQACEGFWQQLQTVLKSFEGKYRIAERVATHDLQFALIAAGYGLGISTQARVDDQNNPCIVSRPLAGPPTLLRTYLLTRNDNHSEQLARFIGRVSTASPLAQKLHH